MGCADCLEWCVDLVISSERNDPFYGEDDVPTAVTGSLSSNHEDEKFKRERMKQLFNRHGFNIAVFPGGNVRGERAI